MDNTNDPNSLNNLNPGLPQTPFNPPPATDATPSSPMADFPSTTPVQNPVSSTPQPDLSSIWTPPATTASAAPLSDQTPIMPYSTPPAPTPTDLSSVWTPPITPDTVPENTQSVSTPAAQSPSIPDLASTWMPPNPTATQPEIPSAVPNPADSSPLNNPWTTPLPSSVPNQPEPAIQPTWMTKPGTSQLDQSTAAGLNLTDASIASTENAPVTVPEISEQPPTQSDPAPTDLSHLISNNSLEIGGQTITPSVPETLVVPSEANSPVPNLPTSPKENHKGIPIWLIGIGIGLLLIVAGASAYFILGVGQQKQSPAASIPAEVVKTTVNTPPPIIAATPIPAATQSASQSASFGQFQSSPPPKASSAADIIKARQGK